MNLKRAYIFVVPIALFVAFFLPAGAAQAATEFFIDPNFDATKRESISATPYYEGNRAKYYIENSFLNSLSTLGKSQLTEYVVELANTFDSKIYERVTYVFGLPWTPGIDGDPKITVLLTPMPGVAGGYIRTIDEVPRGANTTTSNAREMIYLNTGMITKHHIKEFLAHELQHLINYNQKGRTLGTTEDRWLNEMMSEVASIVALYGDEDFIFPKSNMSDRAKTFSDSSYNALLEWGNDVPDYGMVAIFGYYLYDKFGAEFFTALSLSDNTGLLGIEDALLAVGVNKTFEQVFSDWMVAVVTNDCDLGQLGQYCYTMPDLGFDNLHISFNLTRTGDEEVKFVQSTESWAGNWFRFDGNTTIGDSNKKYLTISLNSVISSYFGGMYIVYKSDGTKEIMTAPIESGSGEWSVEDFGESAERVDVVFANFDQRKAGESPATRYELTATLSEDGISHAVSGNSSIKDGDLIRAVSTDDIYIVKLVDNKKFRRLILNPDIFDSYGHLSWEDVKDVSSFVLSQYTISSLVTEVNSDGSVVNGRIFWLTSTQNSDKGTKRWLNVNAGRFEYMGYDWDSIYKINHVEAGNSFYFESTPIVI